MVLAIQSCLTNVDSTRKIIASSGSTALDQLAATGRTVKIFGISVHDTTLRQAAAWIVDRASRGIPTQVSFLNAHCVNVAYADPSYLGALQHNDRIFADGSGVAIAARSSGIRLQENVNGTDLFPLLCAAAADADVPVYLFGGQPGIAERAGARMVGERPTLSVVGTDNGFIESKAQEVALIERINASGAAILLVGLGVPAQELWIARNRHRLAPSVIMGVGGLFDYYSDRIPRAPRLVRAAGCEWIWRLAMEPRRLARRYLLGNMQFLARLAWMRISKPSTFRQQFTA